MNERALRLGSRKSPMAITQSRQVADIITERTGRAVEIIGVTTLGDVSRAQLTQIGGTGGVRQRAARGAAGRGGRPGGALAKGPAGRAADGIVLAALPPRDDPRDALVPRDGAKLAGPASRETRGRWLAAKAHQPRSLSVRERFIMPSTVVLSVLSHPAIVPDPMEALCLAQGPATLMEAQ